MYRYMYCSDHIKYTVPLENLYMVYLIVLWGGNNISK